MSFKETFRNKDFVVTAELPLTPESTSESILQDVEVLDGCVDGYLLTDNQYGQPHMTPLAAAGILLHAGYDPILQLSCRNRNRIALMGELLGARAIGADSLFLVRGGTLPEGYKPRPKAVMDTDAKDLIATVQMINEDQKFDVTTNFLVGAAATVHDPTPDWRPEELQAKADAGAQLVITQTCLDVEILGRYMTSLVANKLVHRLSVIVSVALVLSENMAEWLTKNRHGTMIPKALSHHLAEHENAEEAGIEFCADTIRAIAEIPGVAGINFMMTERLDLIPKVLKRANLS